MYLAKNLFASIVAHTPLVSIDLIVLNAEGEVLLGKRKNRPARGYWFVPGGRILKDERISAAFLRLTREELGVAYPVDQAQFLGVFEHLYADNFSGEDFSTHYVVLAYELSIAQPPPLSDQQHERYCWMSPEQIVRDPQVHDNT